MINVELRLLSAMLESGNFDPIRSGDLSVEHFITDDARIVLDYVLNHGVDSDGSARFPSLSSAQARFADSPIELRAPDPGDTVEALCHEVKIQYMKACCRMAAAQLEDAANSTDNPVHEVLRLAAQLTRSVQSTQKPSYLSMRNAGDRLLNNYLMGELVSPGTIPWPWPTLQKATKGMAPGSWNVIAGRPKHKKTFLGIAAATLPVVQYGVRGLAISMEMDPWPIFLRGTATMAGLRYTEFKNGALNRAEEMRLLEVIERYGSVEGDGEDEFTYQLDEDDEGELPPGFFVLRGTGKDLSWLESMIELFRPHIVLVDSFYLLRSAGGKHKDDRTAITENSRGLKQLFTERNLIGIGTHQINRDGAKNLEGTEGLAWADAIAQDADLVLRAYSGTYKDKPVSALINLAAREVEFEGLLINSQVCSDFSEIAAIQNRGKVIEALKKDKEDLPMLEGEEDEPASSETSSPGKMSLRDRKKALEAKAKGLSLTKTVGQAAKKIAKKRKPQE